MIHNLFYKPSHRAPLVPARELTIIDGQIDGAVETEMLRQVLIVPLKTLDEFRLKPGDLRENIVVDDAGIGDLHGISSGTVLDINGVLIRLTVHCEPCARIADLVNISSIRHRRGYLGTFLNNGVIRIGDHVQSRGVQFEPIPHELRDRIVWYLAKQRQPVQVTQFVRDIGLPLAACRAVPNMVKHIPGAEQLIVYKNRRKAPAATEGTESGTGISRPDARA